MKKILLSVAVAAAFVLGLHAAHAKSMPPLANGVDAYADGLNNPQNVACYNLLNGKIMPMDAVVLDTDRALDLRMVDMARTQDLLNRYATANCNGQRLANIIAGNMRLSVYRSDSTYIAMCRANEQLLNAVRPNYQALRQEKAENTPEKRLVDAQFQTLLTFQATLGCGSIAEVTVPTVNLWESAKLSIEMWANPSKAADTMALYIYKKPAKDTCLFVGPVGDSTWFVTNSRDAAVVTHDGTTWKAGEYGLYSTKLPGQEPVAEVFIPREQIHSLQSSCSP